MKIQKPSPQSGFSLIEIFIVLVMIGILTTLALMQWGSARTDFQRQRIAREFKIYLERARFDSVKRRAEKGPDPITEPLKDSRSRVILNDASSFTVILDYQDPDGDGNFAPQFTRTVNFADRTDAVIRVSESLNYPITLSFDWRGLAEALDGSNQPVTPVLFTICSDCTDSSPDITRISISPSGTVAELRQGQDPETMPTPANTNSAHPTLNCYVITTPVNNANQCVSF